MDTGGRGLGVALLTLAACAPAMALTVPFTENFTADPAGWRMRDSVTPLTWQSSGGPDAGSYSSTTFNFQNSSVSTMSGPIMFRGHDAFDASGDAFVGNWLTGGVTSLSAFVRHDAGVPLTFFTRFATPANSPAVVGLSSSPVPSGVWTQFTIPIGFGNPYIYEGPPSQAFFNSVFGNIGNLQLGVMVPAELAGLNQVFNFDLDQVSIVPEPAAGLLLLAGFIGLGFRRSVRWQ
jgi:hypothetical protein